MARRLHTPSGMLTYVISDLHLHDEEQSYLFTPAKEQVFVRVAAEIRRSGARLVLAGDVLDLTGMNPPSRGLKEFFEAVVPGAFAVSARLKAACVVRPLRAQLEAIRARFPDFVGALSELAAIGALVWIPGNHDCILAGAPGQGLVAEALGVYPGQIYWPETYTAGDGAVIVHGQEFDASNRTDRGCFNRGAVITSSLYRAAMPALAELGLPRELVDAIPAVRPEEAVVDGIETYLGAPETRRFVVAFVQLLERNGYFQGLQEAAVRVLTASLPSLITPARFRRALPDEAYLKYHARSAARKLRLKGARLVVMGHTHERDGMASYVNLGTWIDHLTGMSPFHIRNADRSLPVLRLSDGVPATLFDAAGLGTPSDRLDSCPVLWRQELRAAA